MESALDKVYANHQKAMFMKVSLRTICIMVKAKLLTVMEKATMKANGSKEYKQEKEKDCMIKEIYTQEIL